LGSELSAASRRPDWQSCFVFCFPFEGSVSIADPQGDFSVNVAGLTELVGAPRFAQRKDAIDYRRELARIDDLRDLIELLATRLHAEERSPDAELFGFVLRRRLD